MTAQWLRAPTELLHVQSIMNNLILVAENATVTRKLTRLRVCLGRNLIGYLRMQLNINRRA